METTMQTTENKNLAYLQKALEYNGFGALTANLTDNINRQRDHFTLYAQDKDPDSQGRQLRYELNFSSKDDKYYWNTTKATLISPDPFKNGREHTFFAGKYSANQEQMKALLSGASLYRNKLENSEGKQYSAWQKILFTEAADRYGNHPLKNFYDNNGPRIDAALAKWNDVLSPNNSQRAIAVEQWKKGEGAALVVGIKEGSAVKQERAVVFFDAQFKDLQIVRQSGEVLERDYNKKRGENVMAVPQPLPTNEGAEKNASQENKNTPSAGNDVNTDQNKAVNTQPATENSGQKNTTSENKTDVSEKQQMSDAKMEDRQSRSEKRGGPKR